MKNEYYNPMKYYFKDGTLLDFTGYYEISNYGNIHSIVTNTTYNYNNSKQKQKYIITSVRYNGKVYTIYYHRAIVSSFPEYFGEWFEGAECNHKDENTHNNSFSNLELISRIDNCNYGTRNKRIGKSQINGKKAKKVVQYTLDNEFIKVWPSCREAERVLGFNHNNIACCCNGKYKQMNGYKWKYDKAL